MVYYYLIFAIRLGAVRAQQFLRRGNTACTGHSSGTSSLRKEACDYYMSLLHRHTCLLHHLVLYVSLSEACHISGCDVAGSICSPCDSSSEVCISFSCRVLFHQRHTHGRLRFPLPSCKMSYESQQQANFEYSKNTSVGDRLHGPISQDYFISKPGSWYVVRVVASPSPHRS
jgi:hypothetical protein